MPTSYPYTPSGGPIVAIVQQLRRSFPATVDASTLKKLAIAPKNESYVLGVLRFIGVLDSEGKKTEQAGKVFLHHEETGFQKAFAELVKAAYTELFSLHGDAAWELDTDALISFFRHSAESTQIVGQRQANTFKTLSALTGHAEVQAPRPKQPRSSDNAQTGKKESKPKQPGVAQTTAPPTNPPASEHNGHDLKANPFGLTVRIEVNLPASADQETYDRIFQSIRKNLINRSEP
jgi:hypothetical protein